MKKLFAFFLFGFISCNGSEVFEYKKVNEEVFESSFLDIFELMLDTLPSKTATFFLDTLSLESSEKHLNPIKGVLDLVPDYWSEKLVNELVQGFSLNFSNFSTEELNLEQSIVTNPRVIESLVATKDASYYGRIRLSKFYYDQSKKNVLFFIAVYCGNKCSEAGLVYSRRKSIEDEWELDAILEVWGSGQDEYIDL